MLNQPNLFEKFFFFLLLSKTVDFIFFFYISFLKDYKAIIFLVILPAVEFIMEAI